MKNKSSILIITLLVLSGFMAFATTPATQAQTDNTIVIGVVEGAHAFNVTDIQVTPGETYTIIFHNNDATASHNLRLDVDGDLLDEENVGDADDITIGEPNDDAAGIGGSDAIWQVEWTAPDEDTDIIFYCGYAGHYVAGMEGLITVGEGASAPGFGLFAGIATLLFIGLAIPQLRRR